MSYDPPALLLEGQQAPDMYFRLEYQYGKLWLVEGTFNQHETRRVIEGARDVPDWSDGKLAGFILQALRRCGPRNRNDVDPDFPARWVR